MGVDGLSFKDACTEGRIFIEITPIIPLGSGTEVASSGWALTRCTSSRREEAENSAFDLGYVAGNYRYAKYKSFKVASSSYGYRLTVSGYSGTAGYSLSAHSGSKFTTYDKGQDS